jgi:hypothetical protein
VLVLFLKGAYPPEHAIARANAIIYAGCLAAINHAAKAFRTNSDRVFCNITLPSFPLAPVKITSMAFNEALTLCSV